MLHGMAFLWFLTSGLAVPAAFTPAQGLAASGIVFAAFVKGVTGMGFPVIGVPSTISQQRFAKVVLVALLVVGLSLLRSGVMGWR